MFYISYYTSFPCDFDLFLVIKSFTFWWIGPLVNHILNLSFHTCFSLSHYVGFIPNFTERERERERERESERERDSPWSNKQMIYSVYYIYFHGLISTEFLSMNWLGLLKLDLWYSQVFFFITNHSL